MQLPTMLALASESVKNLFVLTGVPESAEAYVSGRSNLLQDITPVMKEVIEAYAKILLIASEMGYDEGQLDNLLSVALVQALHEWTTEVLTPEPATPPTPPESKGVERKGIVGRFRK